MQYGRQPAGNARKTGKWCDWCHPVYKHHKYCKLYCTRDYFCTSKKYKISACKIRLLMSNDLSFNCRRRKPRTCGLFSACVCTVLHTTPYLLPTVRFIAGVWYNEYYLRWPLTTDKNNTYTTSQSHGNVLYILYIQYLKMDFWSLFILLVYLKMKIFLHCFWCKRWFIQQNLMRQA